MNSIPSKQSHSEVEIFPGFEVYVLFMSCASSCNENKFYEMKGNVGMPCYKKGKKRIHTPSQDRVVASVFRRPNYRLSCQVWRHFLLRSREISLVPYPYLHRASVDALIWRLQLLRGKWRQVQ